MIVAGIDPSLTNTGIAIASDGVMHLAMGVGSRGSLTDSLKTRDVRQRELTRRVLEELMACGVEKVAIEGPSYGNKHGSQHDRSGFWWRLVSTSRSLGLEVVEVPPTVRAKYACGRGNASKDQVLAATVRRYPFVNIEDNNQADAVVLAAIAARLAGEPIEDSLPATHLSALAKVAKFTELAPV